MTEEGNREEILKEERQKKTALKLAVVFLLAALAVLLYLLKTVIESKNQVTEPEEAEKEKTVHVFQKLPDMLLENEAGNEIRLNDELGEASILVYWASWCPHCTEGMQGIEALFDHVESLEANAWLIDKLDGQKETTEQALQYLQSQGIGRETLFDRDNRIYREIGLHMIPTTMIVNRDQIITGIVQGNIPGTSQAEAFLKEAKWGKTAYLAESIRKCLFQKDGALSTTFLEEGNGVPSGNDILSESQGVLLEYAALCGNQDLFDQVWEYTDSVRFREGLMPWVISEKEKTNVNALVDDLRIIGALHKAENKWGGYGETYQKYVDAVMRYNMEGKNPVDCYDVETGQKSTRFTLCYGDLITLKEMDKDVYESTLKLIRGGKISEQFPLYYSYYDYDAKKYEGGTLNMAEALTTLLHLSEVNMLEPDSLEWLEEKLLEGRIYAAYDVQGNPAENGYYESTAVYAIAAMIALEADREDLAGMAVTRMEEFRVMDEKSGVSGLFGQSDGRGIYSFDQGMALLAYEQLERIMQ